MNKKYLLTPVVLSALLCTPFGWICGDEFEDYIQSCAIISKNYRSAVKARESRYGQEYEMYLNTMQRQAGIIQKCVRRLRLGQDFSFSQLTNDIWKIYNENKNARIGKNINVSADPSGVLNVLRFDVEELHRMEFTTEEGGSINPALERKRKLLEMRRLVRFFQRFRSRVVRSYQDISLRNIFEQRCKRMQALATELDSMIRRKHEGTQSLKNNLDREVRYLLSCHGTVMDNARRKHSSSLSGRKSSSSSRRRSKKKGSSVNRLRKDETPQALEQNIRITLRNLHGFLARLETADFQSDQALNRSSGEESADSSGKDPAEVLRKKSAAGDYESMSEKELHELLLRMRVQILKGNSSIDGFDSTTERKYIQTLTREQNRIYRETLKKLKDQGFETEIAVRNAVLKTQFEIRIAKELPPKKEMERILERIRKEEIRSRGKVRF